MSDFPYTDEQVHRFATLDPDWIGEADGHTGYAREFLVNLHNAGIEVTFPEPRYHVVMGQYDFVVRDRLHNQRVAMFSLAYHPDPQLRAAAEAERLNQYFVP